MKQKPTEHEKRIQYLLRQPEFQEIAPEFGGPEAAEQELRHLPVSELSILYAAFRGSA